MALSYALCVTVCFALTSTPCFGKRLRAPFSRKSSYLSARGQGDASLSGAVRQQQYSATMRKQQYLSTVRQQQYSARKIPALFAFGDANIDTGNNDFLNSSVLHNNYPPLGRRYACGIPGQGGT